MDPSKSVQQQQQDDDEEGVFKFSSNVSGTEGQQQQQQQQFAPLYSAQQQQPQMGSTAAFVPVEQQHQHQQHLLQQAVLPQAQAVYYQPLSDSSGALSSNSGDIQQYQQQLQQNQGVYQPLTNLYVSNLSVAVDNDLLFSWFREFGPLVSACVMVDVHTGRSRGYGFVQFENEVDGEAALNGLNGKVMFVPQDRQTIVLRVQRSVNHKGTPSVPSATIFLRNIPNSYDETRLLPLMSQYGEVEKIQLFSIFENPRLLKACVDFKTKQGALNAVNALHRKLLDPTCEVALAARFADQNRRLSDTSSAHYSSGSRRVSDASSSFTGSSTTNNSRRSSGALFQPSTTDNSRRGSGALLLSSFPVNMPPSSSGVPTPTSGSGFALNSVSAAGGFPPPAQQHPGLVPHGATLQQQPQQQQQQQPQMFTMQQPGGGQQQYVVVHIPGQPNPVAVPVGPNGVVTLPAGFGGGGGIGSS